jgi:hypothetical protein
MRTIMVKNFLATPLGAAIAAFVRVFLAAVFGAWANAGFPINTLTGSAVDAYLQAGLVAAGALIGINAVGPWETRYGLGMLTTSTLTHLFPGTDPAPAPAAPPIMAPEDPAPVIAEAPAPTTTTPVVAPPQD